jgi:hypothetical protein
MSSAGFSAITSVDYSASVIAEMEAKTAGRSGLAWEVMDVTAMSYAGDSWRLVVDKGTLDALYAEDTAELGEVARKMFAEIQRVLAPGGKYVLVTMAQGFVLARALGSFAPPKWRGTVDVHPFVPSDGTSRPAYLIVFTAAAEAAAAGTQEQEGHVQLHGDLAQEGTTDPATAEQAAAAVARYQRLGAMAAATPASSSTAAVALSSAALGGATIAPLPVRHDAALFAEVGRQEGDDGGTDSGSSDDDQGIGSAGLSAETLAALADYAVDSGIVDEVNPQTLVDEIMGRGRSGLLAAHGAMDDESSDEDSSDDSDADEDRAAAPAAVPQRPQIPAATGPPTVWVTHEDPYVRRLIVDGMARRPHWNCTVGGGAGSTGGAVVTKPPGWDEAGASRPVVRFHWGEYEEMDWNEVSDGKVHSCCYCIRKGLIRKAQIAFNARKWSAKHPESSFAKSMPETFILELPVRAHTTTTNYRCTRTTLLLFSS